MSQEIHYLETGSQDPFYNLAFEETVLRSRRSGEYLLLWQNDNTIVIGQNQNAEGPYVWMRMLKEDPKRIQT